jgi:riboflavin synthase
VVDVDAATFSVALIPHTLACTTLGGLAVGDGVNLETDLVFKYMARWLAAREPGVS